MASPRPRPLRFVLSRSARSSGSTVMRGPQLAGIARRWMPDRRIRVSWLSPRLRDSDLFLTKGAARAADAALVERLRARGNRIFVDVVDERAPEWAEAADAIVAASFTSFDELAERLPGTRLELVHHHVDPRLPSPTSGVEREFAVGYFGETLNGYAFPGLERLVDFHHVDTSSQRDINWMAAVPRYPLHYAVRNTRDIDMHKPFLKGFTAAHSEANIVTFADSEAVRWLGADYRYLVSPTGDDDEIVGIIERARADYGTDLWDEGLERMRDMLEQVSEPRIAQRLAAMLDR